MSDHLTQREKFFREAATAEGAVCPTCDRYGKQYKRRINSTMARALIALYRATIAAPDREWFHYSEFTTTRNEYEKLQFWKMIEHRPTTESKNTGYWRITPAGRAFVRLKRTMPEYVTVYNNEVSAFSEDVITIGSALGRHFNYQQLMGDAINQPEPEPQGTLFSG